MPKGIYKRTKEHCEKISKAKMGNKIWLGKKHTEKTKQKIRETKIGKKATEKTKQKMSEAHGGKKNSFYGKRHTDIARKKMSKSHQGEIPWNKGKKCPQISGYKNGFWKGNDVKYNGLHMWIRHHKGKASEHKCRCGKQAQDWANIDHKYKRNLDDYVAMCKKCHQEYDKKYNNKKNN